VGAIGPKEGCFLNGRQKEEQYECVSGKKQEGKEGKEEKSGKMQLLAGLNKSHVREARS
jgi:hypothetical protein